MSGADGFFARTALLVGGERLAAFRRLSVAVIGTGGVGSWCAEALVRSGVGRILLVDDDVVSPSNVNRQLPAAARTLGRPKVDVLRERFAAINPDLEIVARRERYTPETAAAFPLAAYDGVVDAIDSVPCKAHLIAAMTACPHVRFLSSMGAGGRLDPARIRTTRFAKVTGDGLARALRQRFRKTGAYPARPFDCVWSDEPPRAAVDGVRGTWMPVTAAFGLHLAAGLLRG